MDGRQAASVASTASGIPSSSASAVHPLGAAVSAAVNAAVSAAAANVAQLPVHPFNPVLAAHLPHHQSHHINQTTQHQQQSHHSQSTPGSHSQSSSSNSNSNTSLDPFRKESTCDICNKTFKTPGYVAKHIASVHEDGGLKNAPRYTCEICNKQFKTPGYVNKHIATVHEDLKRFKCEICGKCFKSQAYVREHEKTHFTGLNPATTTIASHTLTTLQAAQHHPTHQQH